MTDQARMWRGIALAALACAAAVILYNWPSRRMVDYAVKVTPAITNSQGKPDLWIKWAPATGFISKLYCDTDLDGKNDKIVNVGSINHEMAAYIDSDGDGKLDLEVDCQAGATKALASKDIDVMLPEDLRKW